MSRKLPPLSALRAFEAAARCGGFKQAADELAVTPTAISHQIRSLEARIGQPLFERQTRKVVLTEAGQRLYPVLRDGFDAFADVLESLSRRPSRARVTISATIAFTGRWLVPRVSAFRALHPKIDLQLQASDEVVDLETSRVDIAIRYGEGPYPGYDATPLLRDCFAPVANPLLGLAAASDVRGATLIEFEWRRRHPNNPTWTRWFAAAGLAAPEAPPRLRFSDESHAIQAAVAGQGVALVSLPLVREDLAAGRLVRLPGPAVPGFQHHLVIRQGEDDEAVAAGRAWLLDEAAREAR